MKKILLSVLALISATTMFAQSIDADVTITLESQGGSGSISELYMFCGAYFATSPERGSFMQTASNPEDINVYAIDPVNGNRYSSFGNETLVNIPLGIITSKEVEAKQTYKLKFDVYENTTTLKLKDLLTGTEVDIIDGESYSFTISSDPTSPNYTPGYTEGSYSIINDRFVINYTYVNMFGNFDNPGGAWNWAGDFNRNGAIFTKEMTLAADTWYNFRLNINGTIMHNNSEFSRGNAPQGGFYADESGNTWMHTDMAGVYTFTWNHETQELTVTYPTIVVKGAMTSDGTDVVLAPAYDGSTATGTIDFAGHAGEWYTFGVQLNGTTWIGDNDEFTRANNSRAISGDQNMWFEIEDGTVDYVYTFTWTFATNTLTITFPAVAPANTVTTNSNGFLSFASTEDVEFLGGLKAYRGQYNAGTNELTLYEIGTKVPANTGVILWNSNGTAETFNYTTGADVSGVTVGTNNFVGVTTAADPAGIRAAGKEIYCLNGNALKQYVGTDDIPAGKAYLPISVGGGSNNAPKHITMRFNNTTAVDNLDVEAGNVEKFIENGQIYIRRGNEVFNMQGQIVK